MSNDLTSQGTFYHVTHRKRVGLILASGLATFYDTRGVGRVWLCKRAKLAWAIKHVADTHEWNLDSLAVLEVRDQAGKFIKHRDGIYWRGSDIPSECITLAFSPG